MNLENVGQKTRAFVWSSVGASVRGSVWDSVRVFCVEFCVKSNKKSQG